MPNMMKETELSKKEVIRSFQQAEFTLYDESTPFVAFEEERAILNGIRNGDTEAINGTAYAIRLKENNVLRKLASEIESELDNLTAENIVDYAVVYGEFMYKAKSWDYPRRVVYKIEKPAGQMLHLHTFVVTNMESDPRELIAFYC